MWNSVGLGRGGIGALEEELFGCRDDYVPISLDQCSSFAPSSVERASELDAARGGLVAGTTAVAAQAPVGTRISAELVEGVRG